MMIALISVLIAYYFGFHLLALIILCASAINGWLAVLNSTVNPDWYWQEHAIVGLSGEESGAGVGNLAATNLALLTVQVPLAWYLAGLAGLL